MSLPTSSNLETLGYGGSGMFLVGPSVSKSSISLDSLGYGGTNMMVFHGNPAGGTPPPTQTSYPSFLINFI